MLRRSWVFALALALSFAVGHLTGGRDAAVPAVPGVTPAWAGDPMSIDDHATFVSTDGGNAYLWRRDGDRLVLVSHCMRMEVGAEGQATYVSLPGVERGS
ncbi:MAG: hypothetical protein ACT4PE_12220 [Candidatus Eiseniibacteriota bacterium]